MTRLLWHGMIISRKDGKNLGQNIENMMKDSRECGIITCCHLQADSVQEKANYGRLFCQKMVFHLAHSTLEGLKKLQEGDAVLVPVGAGSYIRMTIADSKKLVMGVGAGTALEKDVESSVQELNSRLQELDKAKTSIQQQLDQTVARYEQDREALEELLRRRTAKTRPAS